MPSPVLAETANTSANGAPSLAFAIEASRSAQRSILVRTTTGVAPPSEQRAGDPEAGYLALVNEPYVSCGIPYGAYRRVAPETADLMIAAFEKLGLPTRTPEGTLYIWQRVPEGMSSVTFAERLMEPDIGVVCTPGSAIAPVTADGANPGEGYVRFSLTPTVDDVKKALGGILCRCGAYPKILQALAEIEGAHA